MVLDGRELDREAAGDLLVREPLLDQPVERDLHGIDGDDATLGNGLGGFAFEKGILLWEAMIIDEILAIVFPLV